MFETVNARRAHEAGTSDAAQLRDAILAKLTYSLGKDAPHARAA